jgi:uncharacterized delta-60 repeat protein
MIRWLRKAASCAAAAPMLLMLASLPEAPAQIALDQGFGVGGLATFDFGRAYDDGASDSSFGVGGAGLIETPPQVCIEDLAVQSDNKILIAGYDIFDGNWNFVVTRFMPDGSPDGSFGSGGRVVTDFSRTGVVASQDFLNAPAVHPDDRIVVGGHSNTQSGSSGNYVNAMARYLPNGTLDDTFGQGGRVMFPLGGGTLPYDEISDIHVLPDGKILAASALRTTTALLRLQQNGTLPTNPGDFNADGRVDSQDLVAWKAAFGTVSGGDADGDSDGTDVLIWQRQLGPARGGAAAVPEPAS